MAPRASAVDVPSSRSARTRASSAAAGPSIDAAADVSAARTERPPASASATAVAICGIPRSTASR